MFTDQATIDIAGGNGGNGCVAWRREKYVAKGGPNGGDGGRGGNIFFVADNNTDTLSNYASKKHFKAESGQGGLGSDMHGKSGEDLYLKVPPGTLIYDFETNELLADLEALGDTFLAATGGRGGFGNAHFKSSTRQRPDFCEKGEPGIALKVRLELKLVADVGIIGYPSVGKSTLISVISAAKPKIAAYEFTTLVPNLGVVSVGDRNYVVCDVPGLIEGASSGKGLGITFLRHIERCGLLLHVLDLSRALGAENSIEVDLLVKDYNTIRSELSNYSKTLHDKREVIILNKADLVNFEVKEIVSQLQTHGIKIALSISAATSSNTDELQNMLLPIVLEEREKRKLEYETQEDEEVILTPHIDSNRMGAYRIEVVSDGEAVIHGKRLEQFVTMTDFNSEGGLQRLRDVLDRIGLKKSVRSLKLGDSAKVYIAGKNVSDHV